MQHYRDRRRPSIQITPTTKAVRSCQLRQKNGKKRRRITVKIALDLAEQMGDVTACAAIAAFPPEIGAKMTPALDAWADHNSLHYRYEISSFRVLSKDA